MDVTRNVLSLAVVGTMLVLATGAAGGETLYNGIELPEPWPPRMGGLPREPVTPPYLESPPKVIPIDVGRQLFVDDFLIEETTLERTNHTATYYPRNPVMTPDRPWETETKPNPCAMVFSDGVWYDPEDKLFKMWYMGGYVAGTCYATSTDGLRWEKPELGVFGPTNLVQQGRRDSSTVWLDQETDDPEARFKMGVYRSGRLELSTSPDGVHWSEPVRSGPTGDRTTFFYNPFRERWVFGVRAGASGFGRIRRYWEAEDFLGSADWTSGGPVLWTGADAADPMRDDLKTPSQLYNLDCVAYESLMLGLFTIWRGQPADRAKPNEVCVGFSRDGFHWFRPDRRAFIAVSERQGDWNWGNVQSAGGGCLVVGDRLYFYVSARAGIPGERSSGVCTTGLATLRRDGFVSLNAGETEGSLTTRLVRFQGRRVFVNADVDGGSLQAEVLDADGRVIAPFTRDNCTPLGVDSTLAPVRWKGVDDLASLAGRPVRLRFFLARGSLYAFWVSPDAAGASHGYVAGGGPGFTGPADTVGRAALDRTLLERRDSMNDRLRIVAFGDSITNGVGPAGMTEADTFREIIRRELTEKLGREVEVLNAGVNGDIVTLALGRLERDAIEKRPDVVTVMFGGNEAGFYRPQTNGFADTPRVSCEEFAAALRQVVDRVRAAGIRVVLMTCPPMTERYWGRKLEAYRKNGINFLVKEYAQAMREVAADKGVELVDVYRAFDEDPASLEFFPDGLHPDARGHRVIAEALAQPLERILAGRKWVP